LARLAGKNSKVWGIDIISELVEDSWKNIAKDDVSLLSNDRVELMVRSGWLGVPENPEGFDAIHCGAAAQHMPDELVKQLKIGGTLIIPIGEHDTAQTLFRVDKSEKGHVITPLTRVAYVPLIDEEHIEYF